MKKKIFISHATPDDNDFTRWLALKLIAVGYEVWCDILELPKGGDFWRNIEEEIRQHTIKFLIVQTEVSNRRQGVLQEIAAALKVKKQLQDDNFIIPLMIDERLPYDDINIELVRLNSIDFKRSWALGLQDLLGALEKQKVPKNAANPELANHLYQQIFLQDKAVILKEEVYQSNWFSVKSFPEELRFHKFGKKIPDQFDARELTFPAIKYKEYLCTFGWEYDFVYHLPNTDTYDGTLTIRIPTDSILNGSYESDFITVGEAQRFVVQLMNIAFESSMKNKGLQEYALSNRLAYWYTKGQLEKDKFNKVLLVGKQKDKNWHFGISASAKLYPFPVLMVSSHIFFTEDGKTLIETKSIQHSARRRQGRNWWNEDWKSKLHAFVHSLSNGEDSFYLEVGSEEKILVARDSEGFLSQVSYITPDTYHLEEEIELSDLNDIEEDEILPLGEPNLENA